MKRKCSKKLKLNKQKITALNSEELKNIKGGTLHLDCYSGNNWSYCNTQCYTCPCPPEYGGEKQ